MKTRPTPVARFEVTGHFEVAFRAALETAQPTLLQLPLRAEMITRRTTIGARSARRCGRASRKPERRDASAPRAGPIPGCVTRLSAGWLAKAAGRSSRCRKRWWLRPAWSAEGRFQVCHRRRQRHRLDGRGIQPRAQVEGLRFVGDCMHQQVADTDVLGGMYDAFRGVLEQGSTQAAA